MIRARLTALILFFAVSASAHTLVDVGMSIDAPHFLGPADHGDDVRNQVQWTDDQAGRPHKAQPRQALGQGCVGAKGVDLGMT